ncbi:hypothetical protein XU18_0912 [Perkinsela sp. CCAP 1560/4]|nr:hypothetical protein XU18_0912 [Perkinsela sp. CCAP 1560/4]|eukprot:KNH08597.1 hypothetical protein XU18_0912 [Perkinsela sp. CCAP 1560/4]
MIALLSYVYMVYPCKTLIVPSVGPESLIYRQLFTFKGCNKNCETGICSIHSFSQVEALYMSASLTSTHSLGVKDQKEISHPPGSKTSEPPLFIFGKQNVQCDWST